MSCWVKNRPIHSVNVMHLKLIFGPVNAILINSLLYDFLTLLSWSLCSNTPRSSLRVSSPCMTMGSGGLPRGPQYSTAWAATQAACRRRGSGGRESRQMPTTLESSWHTESPTTELSLALSSAAWTPPSQPTLRRAHTLWRKCMWRSRAFPCGQPSEGETEGSWGPDTAGCKDCGTLVSVQLPVDSRASVLFSVPQPESMSVLGWSLNEPIRSWENTSVQLSPEGVIKSTIRSDFPRQHDSVTKLHSVLIASFLRQVWSMT